MLNLTLRGLPLVSGLFLSAAAGLAVHLAAAADKPAGNPDARARAFVAGYEADVRPLEIALNLAWWKANTSGKDEDFAAKVEAQNKLRRQAGRSRAVRRAQGDQANRKVTDPILRARSTCCYRTYLEKQVDPELLKRITSKANEIEKAFNVYRAKLDGREIADSEVRQILKESKDSAERQAVWESSKGVGAAVERRLAAAGRCCATRRPASWASTTITSCSCI